MVGRGHHLRLLGLVTKVREVLKNKILAEFITMIRLFFVIKDLFEVEKVASIVFTMLLYQLNNLLGAKVFKGK